jgi:hypothetical protein
MNMKCKFCSRNLEQTDIRSQCRACGFIAKNVKAFLNEYIDGNAGDFAYFLKNIGYKSEVRLEVLSRILQNQLQNRGFKSQKSGW